MELLAAMGYTSSPSPRLITIIWVPVHTKPALGPVARSAEDRGIKNFDGPIPAGAGAGGNLFDYLLCRKSCRYPGGYVKDDRPRCVQPETHNISRPSIRSIVDVFHAEGFSTMRRFDSTFDTTDPHEAFKPPVDDAAADAPAEPGTEREEAVDDAPAAPDKASSGP